MRDETSALCVVCKTKRRTTNPLNGKPMTVCDDAACATEAMKRLDRAGIIPDAMANRLGLRARKTLCVECGPNVAIDEDGCCRYCGNGATGSWLDGDSAAVAVAHEGGALGSVVLTDSEREALRWVQSIVRAALARFYGVK